MIMTNHLEPGEDFPSVSPSTFSIHSDETELALGWELRGKKRSKSPSLAYCSPSLDEPGDFIDHGLDDGAFDNDYAADYFVDDLALPEENTMNDEEWKQQHRHAHSPTTIDHVVFSMPPNNVEMPMLYHQDTPVMLEAGCPPVNIFTKTAGLGKCAPSYGPSNDTIHHGATKVAAIVTPKTKKTSVDIEQIAMEEDSAAIMTAPNKLHTGPSSFLERVSKRTKLEAIAVAEVDVPLDYTSQKSTIGHQVWRRSEVRGPRRLISVVQAKALIKKHKQELVKLGYTREPVFLVKKGNKRAQKGSPLYRWNRSGKDFYYSKASIAAIQYAVNQNNGNNSSSKRPSLAGMIQQCEDKLSALDKSHLETAANAAALQTTLLALKREPFCGKSYSSMLGIERLREKSLITMLTRMMKEVEPSTP